MNYSQTNVASVINFLYFLYNFDSETLRQAIKVTHNPDESYLRFVEFTNGEAVVSVSALYMFIMNLSIDDKRSFVKYVLENYDCGLLHS